MAEQKYEIEVAIADIRKCFDKKFARPAQKLLQTAIEGEADSKPRLRTVARVERGNGARIAVFDVELTHDAKKGQLLAAAMAEQKDLNPMSKNRPLKVKVAAAVKSDTDKPAAALDALVTKLGKNVGDALLSTADVFADESLN